MSFIVLGESVQGLIAASLLGRKGHQVTLIDSVQNRAYTELYEGCKTGPITHLPLAIPNHIIEDLDLKSYGFEVGKDPASNPFEALPFYDGLVLLVKMFQSLEDFRPSYNEKAWRDTWSTFEIGRVLSGYDANIQNLFAQSATLSLNELLDATDLSDQDKADIIMQCILGSKTDPSAKGSAASILPAMVPYVLDDHVVLNGSVHGFVRALKQSAMAHAVTIIDDKDIEKILTEGEEMQVIQFKGGETIAADYYILDDDPVRFFENYLADYPLLPTFRNRITPMQNQKTCINTTMVVTGGSAPIQSGIVAPSTSYVQTAMADLKKDGGSQYPCISVVDCSSENQSLVKDGHHVYNIMAQYFEEDVQDLGNFDAISQAVKQSVLKAFPDVENNIVYFESVKAPTQFGQPTFIGLKPLLQLYKIFSGHHSLGYDLPLTNMLIAGYGFGCAGHYHTMDGGVRVSGLFDT
jgi:phytoene dehydrogenase-like protein